MDLADTYGRGIARGVIRYAKSQAGWQVFGYGNMLHPLNNLSSWRGDGIIARILNQQEREYLLASKLPVVDVAGSFPEAGFATVSNDDLETGREAARHLLACGFQRFAFCGIDMNWSNLRLRGFSEILANISVEPLVFISDLASWMNQKPVNGLAKWLKKNIYPCAFFVANDAIGLKLTRTLHANNIIIPDDAAIVGVDNEDVLCELADPSLSSIPCDCEQIGHEAAELLKNMLAGNRDNNAIKLIQPKPVIIRASTDTMSGVSVHVRQAVRFIRQNIHKGINVSDVVREVPTSRRSLEMRFRKELKRTIHDEIMRIRLDLACRLLEEGLLNASEIGYACGFSTPQHFYHAFRNYYHIPPLSYIRRRRSGAT